VKELEIGVAGGAKNFDGGLHFLKSCHSCAENDRFLFEGNVADEGVVCEFAGRDFVSGHSNAFELVGGVFVERGGHEFDAFGLAKIEQGLKVVHCEFEGFEHLEL